MNPLILLGAQSGARHKYYCIESIAGCFSGKMPVLGYTIPYALGNILLTAQDRLLFQ
jgi:putative transport protein